MRGAGAVAAVVVVVVVVAAMLMTFWAWAAGEEERVMDVGVRGSEESGSESVVARVDGRAAFVLLFLFVSFFW